MPDVNKGVFQLFGLNVKEVSLVKKPAVPKATFLVVKSAAEVEETLSALDLLDEAIEEGDQQGISSAIRDVRRLCAAMTGEIEKFLDDEKDWMVSDDHWAMGLLLSTRGVFSYLAEKLDEEGKGTEAEGALADVRALIKRSAQILSNLVDDMKIDESEEMNKATKAEEEVVEEVVEEPIVEKPEEEVVAEPEVDKLDAVLAAVTTLTERIGAQEERLTIIESKPSNELDLEAETSEETNEDEDFEFETFSNDDLKLLTSMMDDLDEDTKAKITTALDAHRQLVGLLEESA